ncbi:hypothetical protein DY000_02037816 [Brassica cretica]|uniref:Uncharacterized protein n=1 Tax=Brassica cretica TaxID=69181 RepID=A0ABQ7BFG3_BRACR|nr:hypothetical protein DY000_02037816 [Brassica cretica]
MSWQHHLLLLIRLYDLLRRGKRSPNFPQQNWFIAFLFLMALGFFCLALFFYLSLDPDSGYTSASAAPSGEEGVEMSWQHHLLLLIRLYDLLRRGKRSPNFPQQNWFIAFLFLMALGFFCLALFFYLSLDPDSGYTSASAAPSGEEGVEITYGNAIKLMK